MEYFQSSNLVNKYIALRNNCFVEEMNFRNFDWVTSPAIFLAPIYFIGHKSFSRDTGCPEADDVCSPERTMALESQIYEETFPPWLRGPPRFLRSSELVAKKYYYRRIACKYAETCFYFRSRVLSQQCMRYTTDIYIGEAVRERKNSLSLVRKRNRERERERERKRECKIKLKPFIINSLVKCAYWKNY